MRYQDVNFDARDGFMARSKEQTQAACAMDWFAKNEDNQGKESGLWMEIAANKIYQLQYELELYRRRALNGELWDD